MPAGIQTFQNMLRVGSTWDALQLVSAEIKALIEAPFVHQRYWSQIPVRMQARKTYLATRSCLSRQTRYHSEQIGDAVHRATSWEPLKSASTRVKQGQREIETR